MTKENDSLVKRFFALNGSSVLVAMIVVSILFEILLQITKGGNGLMFLTSTNLLSIFRQQVYIGIIAFGMTLVMITGNIDLSVGYQLTFLGCLCGLIMVTTANALLAVPVTLAAGMLCGLINGALVGYVKLNSFITTLGTSSIYFAFAFLVSSGNVIVINDDCDPIFKWFGKASFGPISILVVWFLLTAVILALVLSRTVFGQQLYMVGSNPVAARFSGIKSARNITIAYVIVGLLCALAAVITMSNVYSANPQSTSGKEMEVLLCVVLGGCAVYGGKGSCWATIIGVLFYGVLSSGFTMLGVNEQMRMIIMGLIMVFVLSLDAMKVKGVKLWKKK